METKAVMQIIETDDFKIQYECSLCASVFKATKKFEKRKTCPDCESEIDYFEVFEDEEE
jgi:peptide subunit release factor 1 (eRF1)